MDAPHAREVGAREAESRTPHTALVPHGADDDRSDTAALAIRRAHREGGISMKELLRISMSEAQVRTACKEFAMRQVATSLELCTVAVVLVPQTGVTAEVIFTKKRVRTNSTKEKAT
jgi:hypothetical protein